jgi:hypothetical protein
MHDQQSAAGATAMTTVRPAASFVARGYNWRWHHSAAAADRGRRMVAHVPKGPGPELPGNTPVETPSDTPDESPFDSPEEHPDSVPPQSPANPPPEMPELPRSDDPESPGRRSGD